MRLAVHLLPVFTSLTIFALPVSTLAHTANVTGVNVEKLLETEKSWDGDVYPAYPKGTPQISVLKITVAPNTFLAWHKHPIPNAAYVLKGGITVEKRGSHEMRTLKAGDMLPEMVNSAHRGFTGEQGATLIVFYAGHKGIPLSEAAP